MAELGLEYPVPFMAGTGMTVPVAIGGAVPHGAVFIGATPIGAVPIGLPLPDGYGATVSVAGTGVT